MKTQKTISVIIPVHNRHDLFEKCLISVSHQNIKKFKLKIIVVDEASSPPISVYIKKSLLLNKFKNITIIKNNRALGPSLARTIGMKKIEGEYVAFLDSDDFWEDDFLSSTISNLDFRKSEIASSLVNTIFIGNISIFKKSYFYLINLIRNIVMTFSSISNGGVLPYELFYLLRLSSMVFTRKSIGNAKFVMSYRTGEDWKFFWDCIRNNRPIIKIIGKSLVNATYHNRSETFRRSNYWKYYTKLINELPDSMKNTKGIEFFKWYTNFSIWKNRNVK